MFLLDKILNYFKSKNETFRYVLLVNEHEKWKIEWQLTKTIHSYNNMVEIEDELNEILGYQKYPGSQGDI